MSDENGGKGQGFTPPATQEELNRIIADRVERARKPFADYDDLKSKAAEFDKLSESKKTSEDKAAERLTALEAELAKSRGEAIKSRIQAKHGLSDEDADLFLTASDPDGLEAQAKALASKIIDRKKNGPIVDAQTGFETDTKLDPMREFSRNLFGS